MLQPSSVEFRYFEDQFHAAGFRVDVSGPNAAGDVLVTTLHKGGTRIGPSGSAPTAEEAIRAAWAQFEMAPRKYLRLPDGSASAAAVSAAR